MTHKCYEKCTKYRSDWGYHAGVFCKLCNLFMKFDGRYCPCCGNVLRHKPRYKGKRDVIYAM